VPDPERPLDGASARARLRAGLRPHATRAQLLAAVLCGLLGFALVVQARQTQAQGLTSLRQSDLIGILDNVTDRATRLEDEARRLQDTSDRLRSGADRATAAEQAARERLDVLGVLAGTAPATGPGIVLQIPDPAGRVDAATLLDALQELRDAGAEAVQIGSTRVVAGTSFVDAPSGSGVRVDGALHSSPYRFVAIGDPPTLSSALNIPGGVLEGLRRLGSTATVERDGQLTVDALRVVATPQYARPAPSP
jgi:uncharacterized protein YlxW (UPF0749 family)